MNQIARNAAFLRTIYRLAVVALILGGAQSQAADQGIARPTTRAMHAEVVGVQPNLPSDVGKYDEIIGRVSGLGVKWVRMYWMWSWVEGSKGLRNLEPIKIVVNAAHKRGMKIIVLVTGAPPWANGGKGQDFPPADDKIGDYAAYAAAVAQTDADALEIWNEPNNRGFWASGPDPVKMARMQVAAYAAIKAIRPNTLVVTGGLTQVFDDPQTFFAKMIAADPKFVESFDAVGLHPYNEPTDPLQSGVSGMKNIMTIQTPAIHRLLAVHGRKDVPIWFTEYGVATHGQWSVDESKQAVYLSHFFEGVAALRGQGINVGVSIIYALQDSSPYRGTDDQPFFGLLRHDGTEKPAAAIVRRYAASSD